MATNPISTGSTAPASSTTPASGAGSSSTSASSSTNSSDSPEATKQQFISLLVAQLQNQDPLNPSDGTQFLSQLTEINSFEQLLYIRQDLDKMSGQSTAASATGSSGGSGSSSSTSANSSTQPSTAGGSPN
jgi:flagellar basal-body rod modification protein FlgD